MSLCPYIFRTKTIIDNCKYLTLTSALFQASSRHCRNMGQVDSCNFKCYIRIVVSLSVLKAYFFQAMENMDYTYNRILTCKKRCSNSLYRLMLHISYQVVENVSEVDGRESIAHTRNLNNI